MAGSRAIGAATIAEAFRITVEDHPDRVAVRTLDDDVSLTWAQLRDRSDALAGGLARLGVKRGDTVALMISNRPEFGIADLAAMTLGATPFSIYLTSAPDQVAYVIRDAGARVAIVEAPFAPLVQGLVEHVLIVGEWEEDPAFDAEPHWRAIEPDDILTLIYTSGTTGPPKGVQIAHRNQMAAVDAVEQRVGFPDGSRVISWLPSAHVAERTAHHYLPIVYAMTITCCPDPRQIGTYLPAVKPTWFFAVPRVWEKLKAGLEAKLAGDEQALALIAAGARAVELEQAGEEIPEELAATRAIGEEKLFAPLRAAIGLDQAELVNVGAAPTPRDVFVFFHALGVPLAEIWGMSETCGAGASNPAERIKIGTVGLPSPGVELMGKGRTCPSSRRPAATPGLDSRRCGPHGGSGCAQVPGSRCCRRGRHTRGSAPAPRSRGPRRANPASSSLRRSRTTRRRCCPARGPSTQWRPRSHCRAGRVGTGRGVGADAAEPAVHVGQQGPVTSRPHREPERLVASADLDLLVPHAQPSLLAGVQVGLVHTSSR